MEQWLILLTLGLMNLHFVFLECIVSGFETASVCGKAHSLSSVGQHALHKNLVVLGFAGLQPPLQLFSSRRSAEAAIGSWTNYLCPHRNLFMTMKFEFIIIFMCQEILHFSLFSLNLLKIEKPFFLCRLY